MKVLVTGGSGFIGGHLVERLIKEGHEVYIFDMLYPKHYLEGFNFSNNFTMGSLFMEEELREAIKGMDFVFHLAALANTNLCANYPPAAVKSNCIGTVNVLQASLENDVQRVFIASSSLTSDQLYWEAGHNVCDDDLIDLCSTGHSYTSTKLFSEMLARDYASMYGLPYTVLRFGICYGPRMTPGVLVDTYIKNVLADRPMVIHGDGEQWRYYLYVDDLVDGCIKALSPRAVNRTYNLVPPWQTTVSQVAKAVQYVLGGDILYKKNRQFDFDLRPLCPTNDIGWKATTELEDGISETAVWYAKGDSRWNV